MNVGCVKEIKTAENRVGLTPDGARQLAQKGHTVLIEKNAGTGSGFSDADYQTAGAKILDSAALVWNQSDLIVKVKEPLQTEWPLIKPNQIIFTYFHFASNEKLLDALLSSRATAIAYETVGDKRDHPLLKPMSEVAGRMSALVGAYYLAKFAGGKGLLISGVSGVSPAHVVILGSGVVGQNAGLIAQGLQCRLTFLVHSIFKKPELQKKFPSAQILELTSENIQKVIPTADLAIGAVYVFGEKAPILVSKKLVSQMQPGSVIVDVAVDQGGCFETSRPTTHQDPVYVESGVVHYCVANMPGAFPKTSTLALTNATFSFVQQIADHGLLALKNDSALLNGLTTLNGKLVNADVAKTFGRKNEKSLF